MNVTLAEWVRLPLVPVADTVMIDAELKVQETVEAPEPVMLDVEKAHAVLLLARPTTPAKLFNPVTVRVEVTVEPALPVTLMGLAVIVKS